MAIYGKRKNRNEVLALKTEKRKEGGKERCPELMAVEYRPIKVKHMLVRS